MAAQKATITLDRAKAERARKLIGAASTSEVIDVALTRLLASERLARDVAIYRGAPLDELRALCDLPVALDLGDADVDYDAKYARPKRRRGRRR